MQGGVGPWRKNTYYYTDFNTRISRISDRFEEKLFQYAQEKPCLL